MTFDAAYGNEQVGLYLYSPRDGVEPFQTVVYFPGSNALWMRSFDQYSTNDADMIVRGGRAFAFPIYQSTFDRDDGFVYRRQDETNTYRDHVIHWSKDLGRTWPEASVLTISFGTPTGRTRMAAVPMVVPADPPRPSTPLS